jgi:RNA polymerase sigma-70 factor (ECF subfamily)
MRAMDNTDDRKENVFPDTPRTLIRRIPELSAGKDDGAWKRFVDIYEPALRHFVALAAPYMPSADVDDVVQDTFIRLVDVLRSGSYDPSRARFRTYLATITRRLVIDRFRRDAAQRAVQQQLLEVADICSAASPDPAFALEVKWRMACRAAAEERVLTQSALAASSKKLWRLVSSEGMSVKEAAKTLGIPANTASKVKRRIETMVAAVEAEFDDMCTYEKGQTK